MKNLQMIEVRYLGATETKGVRIKLVDTRFNTTVTLNRDYSITVIEQAIEELEERGFEIVAKTINEINNREYILVNDFEPLTIKAV